MSRPRMSVSALFAVATVIGAGALVHAADAAKPAAAAAAAPAAAAAASASDAKSLDATLGCDGCAPLNAKDIESKMAKLKALEGTWMLKDGQPEQKGTFHVIANGTAVVETMMP